MLRGGREGAKAEGLDRKPLQPLRHAPESGINFPQKRDKQTGKSGTNKQAKAGQTNRQKRGKQTGKSGANKQAKAGQTNRQKREKTGGIMFDVVALAPWPMGALFAKKLSGRGRKLCHIELAGRDESPSFASRSASPFPCLIGASQAEEKAFLESVGFLSRQEGGFWLLSLEGNWPLQDIAREMLLKGGSAPPALSCLFQKAKGEESQNLRKAPPKRKGETASAAPPARRGALSFSDLRELDFQSEWVSLLAAGLSARIFEDNMSRLSGSRPSSAALPLKFFKSRSSESLPARPHGNSFSEPLDFFSDCFLFEPSLKKKRFFQERHSDISWRRAELSSIKYQEGALFINGEKLPAREIFWFGEEFEARRIFPSLKGPEPEWEWISFEFKGDLGGYEGIVPKHFVSVGHESLPWTHDNLLSVFRRGGAWEVWLRRPFSPSSPSSPSSGAESESLAARAAAHLSRRFPKLRLLSQKEGRRGSNSAGKLSAPAAGWKGQNKKSNDLNEPGAGNGDSVKSQSSGQSGLSQKKGFLIYGPEALSRPASGAPPQVFLEDLRESPKGDIMSRLDWELRLSERSLRKWKRGAAKNLTSQAHLA